MLIAESDMMHLAYRPRTDIRVGIAALRMRQTAQAEVIARLEEYYRSVVGSHGDRNGHSRSGYASGYLAELDYLHARRSALDALIESVEKYELLTGGANKR
ncbi:MAG TPA: hypothetical protein VHB50_10890 [Bryobacteraceae bacterium]|nr:hypothetical protein [Bryobacteraceae bacterium]